MTLRLSAASTIGFRDACRLGREVWSDMRSGVLSAGPLTSRDGTSRPARRSTFGRRNHPADYDPMSAPVGTDSAVSVPRFGRGSRRAGRLRRPDVRRASRSRVGDPGPIHVHGLGVNPSDGSLFVATHTGLFRAAPNEMRARRVGDRYQDTMGFTVVGPDRFLGSGHPDGREQLPPYLGLIESADAGRSWQPVSLLGEADFHVLEASGRRIYGYGSDFESREPRFLTSTDGGQSWRRLQAPEPLISLSISPEDPRAVIASGEGGIFRSTDAGRSWSEVDAPSAGLIAWTSAGVILVDLDGRVWGSADPASGQWRPVGEVGGQPAALETGARR